MDGIFLRKKFNIWLFIMLISGLFFIGLYIFLKVYDPLATSETVLLLILGLMIILCTIPSWLLNSGAFIRVESDSIKAKYNWFGKIDCKLSDVVFAEAGLNTLIIQLSDGKTHTVMGLDNSYMLASMIRRSMSFNVTEQPDVLIKKLDALKQERKKGILYVISGIAVMFVLIFVTVFLTDEKETEQFNRSDWIVFAIMCLMEIVTVFITFRFANKTGKKKVPIEKLQYTVRRKIIETQPTLPGFVKAVYSDDNYTYRVTLSGFSDKSDVYFSVQEFNPDYALVLTGESPTYESRDEIPVDFGALIDITDKVLH